MIDFIGCDRQHHSLIHFHVFVLCYTTKQHKKKIQTLVARGWLQGSQPTKLVINSHGVQLCQWKHQPNMSVIAIASCVVSVLPYTTQQVRTRTT